MKAETVDIQYKYGQRFTLWPLGDIHLMNKTCDKKKLKADIRRAADIENLFVVGLGDWLDSIIITDKRYRKATDAIPGESAIDDGIAELKELLLPIRNNIISICDGNHELTIIKQGATNPIKRLAQELATDDRQPIYFGMGWLLQLQFREGRSRGRSLVIRGHHGWGGGSRTEGAPITKYSHDVKFWQADLFLYGHDHKIKVNPMDEGRMIGRSSWKTITKKMLICGTYQRTSTTNETTTWAESRGFPPTGISNPRAVLRPNGTSGVDVELIV